MNEHDNLTLAQRQLCEKLGYQFRDTQLLLLALSHRSASKNNNERLEFLGDSILNFLIAEALFQRYPEAREGELSRMRAQLVKGVTLAQIARRFGLGECLLLGPGEMKSGGRRRESILADAVEALIGAIYREQGLDVTRARVLAWFADLLEDVTPEVSNKDAKTRLQEWLQGRKQVLPQYELVATHGDEHQREFEVACRIAGSDKPFYGRGRSRRAAEQQAAANALATLQVDQE